MPKLEQLWMTGIASIDAQAPPDGDHGDLKHLKAIILDGLRDQMNLDKIMHVSRLVSFGQAQALQHLDITSEFEDLHQSVFDFDLAPFINPDQLDWPEPNIRHNNMRKLRHFRSKGVVVNSEVIPAVMRESLEGNKLQSFDITFPQPLLDEIEGLASCGKLREFSWLEGIESIRSLGIFNFRFRRYPMNDDSFPLPKFLASFPNLETLEISSDQYEDAEFCSVVAAIMKATHLKTIYQETVRGASLDSLRQVAEALGVELVWGQRPRTWPVVLDE